MSQYIYDSKTKNITPVAGLFNNPIGYPVMTGATNTEDGKGGLVPQPKIEDMNKALFGDGTYKDIENNNDSISNRWNNTKEYSVGDYCIHNNILWNCLTAHTNQTPIMDSTYWKQCNITEEMHKLNAIITYNSNEIGRLNENITINNEDIEVLEGNISKNSSDIEVLSGVVDNNNDYLRHVTTTNMFKPTMATTTLNGVTCTNNGDGTFTVNGTATAVTFFCIGTVSDNMLSMGEGDTQIKLLGCPKSSQPYYVLRWQHDDDHNKYKDTYLEGAVISFSNINYDTYYNRAWIRIEANNVCDNLVFKPMFTTNLEATYDDFVPYTGDTGLINREVSTLVSQMKETVSDAWDKTVTYGINAYCIHKNALWKCLLQHTNQEPVNGSIYWEKCTVATELSKLNSDLVNIHFTDCSSIYTHNQEPVKLSRIGEVKHFCINGLNTTTLVGLTDIILFTITDDKFKPKTTYVSRRDGVFAQQMYSEGDPVKDFDITVYYRISIYSNGEVHMFIYCPTDFISKVAVANVCISFTYI